MKKLYLMKQIYLSHLLLAIPKIQSGAADDKECLDAFKKLSRMEGIIPALESAHTVAYAMRIASSMTPEQSILINLSGRGDKDADFSC